MTLGPDRRRAYTFGALTGAFAAVGAVAARDRRLRWAATGLAASLACGALAVAFEERAGVRAGGRSGRRVRDATAGRGPATGVDDGADAAGDRD